MRFFNHQECVLTTTDSERVVVTVGSHLSLAHTKDRDRGVY